jgi:hypothetical protein
MEIPKVPKLGADPVRPSARTCGLWIMPPSYFGVRRSGELDALTSWNT